MPENASLIEYYRNLLILQYRQKPKSEAMVEEFIKALMVFDIIDDVRNGYNISTAVGPQLDILSLYVGASRYVPGTYFYRQYFGYVLYGDTAPFLFNGYIKYGDTAPDVQFRTYAEGKQSDYALTDAELRKFIELRIIKNNSTGSLKDIDDFLLFFFSGTVYVEEEANMELTYYVPLADVRIFTIAREMNVLPSPAGVGVFVVAI